MQTSPGPPITIPFNKPYLGGNEMSHMAEAIRRLQISGDGHFTRLCHELLETELRVPKVLLTTSCTHALEMTALLLKLREGDEVIVPSFAFVTTANAFALRGAKPVFIDARPDTLNMDERQLARLIGPKTRAIIALHYAGVGCEMDAIMEIANHHRIPVIEDNAHGLFGAYRGKPLGTFGCMATQSFHETKNFTCGEGGALLINDPAFIERAEIVREKGTDRNRFFRGQVDKYTWIDLGSSYLLGEILAAYLYGQLQLRESIQATRRRIWERYQRELADWAARYGIALPHVPAHCRQAYHLYYLLLPSLEVRQALIAHLRARAIQAVFHYLPLHLSAMGQTFGGKPGDCPVAENISDRLLRLPFFNVLTDAEQGDVIRAIQEFTF